MPEWDDDDDDTQASDLVKNLRKQLKDLQAKNKELDTELGTLRPQVRKSSLTSILSELGVNPKIAGLLPSDVEPVKESVSKWIEEYGDVFNLKPVETNVTDGKPVEPEALQGQKTQVVDTATQQAWAKAQGGDSAVGATGPDLEKTQAAELTRAFQAAGGSADKYFSILRGETPIT